MTMPIDYDRRSVPLEEAFADDRPWLHLASNIDGTRGFQLYGRIDERKTDTAI